MLVNKKGGIFVGQRADQKSWQMPQGGVDRLGETTEDFEKTAWRELGEEVGTQNCKLLGQTKGFYFYDFPGTLFSKWSLWRLRFRGQKQKWFVFLFCGQDSEIDLCSSEHQEFLQWKWVCREELERYTPDFKKEVYAGVVAELWPCVEKALEASDPTEN